MKRSIGQEEGDRKRLILEGKTRHNQKNNLTYMLQYSSDLVNINQIKPEMLFTTCPIAGRILIVTEAKSTLIRRRNGKCIKTKTWLPSSGSNNAFVSILDGFLNGNNIYIMDCIQWKGHFITNMPFFTRLQYFNSQMLEASSMSNKRDKYVWHLLPLYELSSLKLYLTNCLTPATVNNIKTSLISTAYLPKDEIDGILFISRSSTYKFSENGLNLDLKWCPKERIEWLGSLIN
eukprot:NODE_369_length_9975_cov_0.256582.p5 type:complete len:233 gc:universal NODE_369_length_9975_cov_0.256582:626-1324(+)